jgi:hypothetical protein
MDFSFCIKSLLNTIMQNDVLLVLILVELYLRKLHANEETEPHYIWVAVLQQASLWWRG